MSEIKNKKIGVFIDWYLPGYKAGGPIQSCVNLIDHLNEFAEFKVITRNTDYTSDVEYSNVKKDEWNILENNHQVFYISKENLNAKTIKNILEKEKFDIIYLNGVFSYLFTQIPLRNFTKTKIIVAARGMLSPNALAVKKFKKAIFLRLAKTNGLFKGVTFHATTKDERLDIYKVLGRKTNVKVASNLPRKNANYSSYQKKKIKGELNLVNIARVAPEKNLAFALEILKEVKCKVNFDFYGPKYDEKYFEQCMALIKQMPSNVKVKYRNAVDSNLINGTLKNYHCMFMPTRGENFGHIILESFQAGCPVLISNKTPWKNLESKKLGFDIDLNERSKFVDAINKMCEWNQMEYDEFSNSSFEFGMKKSTELPVIEENKLLFNLK